MKIIHINSYYSNRFFYSKMYEEQEKLGEYVDVVVPVTNNFSPLADYKSNVHLVEAYSSNTRFFYLRRFKKITNKIKENFKIEQYDVIHAHSLFTNGTIAYLLSKDYQKKYVVAVRNADVNIFFKYIIILRWLGRKVLNNASAVIFLSESYREKITKKYCKNLKKENTCIIPNGVDDFWLNNIYYKNRVLDKRKIIILYVGEVNKNKNLLTVADAIEKINTDKKYFCEYNVVGTVKDEQVKNKLQSYSFVKMHDPVQKEELIHFYRSADIFIMASFAETFGLAYVEAMSQGLPVIYTKNQGFDQQFDEGMVGYHVNPKSKKDIIDKINNIINNYSEISAHCIKCAEKYSWNNIVEKYQAIYKKVLE